MVRAVAAVALSETLYHTLSLVMAVPGVRAGLVRERL